MDELERLDREDWRRGHARSTVGGELLAGWFGVAVWTAFSVPLVWKLTTDVAFRASPWAWLVYGFVGVGVLILASAIRRTLERIRFGAMVLDLDPSPGTLGGHAGGSLRVPLRIRESGRFRVSLSCVHSAIRGRGKNRSRSESVLWSQERVPTVERASRASLLRFTFPVPDHLPASSPTSDDHHYWAIRVTGRVPGLDLDQSFQIPVVQASEPAFARLPALGPTEHEVGDPLDDGPIRVTQEAGHTVVEYPPLRSAVAGVALTFGGAVFFGVPAAMAAAMGKELMGSGAFSIFMLIMAAPILTIFSVVGLALLMLGFFLLLNGLTVRMSTAELEARRRWLLFARTRRLAVADVDRIEMRITGQTGSGAKARVSYTITAFPTQGPRLVLGDGIEGSAASERLARVVTEATGLEVERVQRRKKRKDRSKPSVAAPQEA